MSEDELVKTLKELENDVIETIEKKDNPCKIYSCVFPYSVRFTIEDDGHNTEVIINTKSEEFYTAVTKEDVLNQKELSDQYSQLPFIKRINKYVENHMWSIDPENCELTYTGSPEITEMSEERLSTFQREIFDGE